MLQIGQNICSSPYCFQLDCVWTADNHEAVIQKKKKAYRENRIVTKNINIYRGYQKRAITKLAVRQIAVLFLRWASKMPGDITRKFYKWLF